MRKNNIDRHIVAVARVDLLLELRCRRARQRRERVLGRSPLSIRKYLLAAAAVQSRERSRYSVAQQALLAYSKRSPCQAGLSIQRDGRQNGLDAAAAGNSLAAGELEPTTE